MPPAALSDRPFELAGARLYILLDRGPVSKRFIYLKRRLPSSISVFGGCLTLAIGSLHVMVPCVPTALDAMQSPLGEAAGATGHSARSPGDGEYEEACG